MPITINGSGTVTGLSAGGLPDGSITSDDIAAGAVTAAKLAAGAGGKILQVVQAVKSDTDSTTSTTFVDITGFSASITPSSSSNKILVQVVIGALGNDTSPRGTNFQLLRGSTGIALGDNAAGGQASFGDISSSASYSNGGIQFSYLDSPATTSSTTYKVQWHTWANTVYFNRSSDATTTQSWNRRYSSQIILMEVAG